MKKFLTWCLFEFAFQLINLLCRTYRMEFVDEGNRNLATVSSPYKSYALATWHELLLMVTLGQRGYPFCPLASRSFFGKMMAHVLQRFGFHPVFGSQNRPGKDKGGREARAELGHYLKMGFASAFTVDGSVGPRRVVKPGIVDIAKKNGVPILPVAAASDRYWELNTWDRLKVPKPFARIRVVVGTPIVVPEEISKEDFSKYQLLVAEGINAAERKALFSTVAEKVAL